MSPGLGLPGTQLSRIFVKPRSKFFDAMGHQFTLNFIQKLKNLCVWVESISSFDDVLLLRFGQ